MCSRRREHHDAILHITSADECSGGNPAGGELDFHKDECATRRGGDESSLWYVRTSIATFFPAARSAALRVAESRVLGFTGGLGNVFCSSSS